MTTLICTACGTRVPRNEAIQRTDLRTVRVYHRDCYTVIRALVGIDFAALGDMPLTRRLLAVELRTETMGS